MARKEKVFVGLSGGVDSSVAAMLLKKRGYDVTGVFLKCFNVDGCAAQDAEDARRVAAHLGIPFYVFDLEEEYKEKVVSYMIKAYAAGMTPNPDVMCNREIKFGLFLKKALSMGADYVATGHYVQKRGNVLAEARDKNKDQSYFLWTLTQEQLAHCFFPIGDYVKPKVRALARAAGLPTADKKDSQGICFLGKVSIRDFLKEYLPAREGVVVSPDGSTLGTHEGAHLYTIGQRHGLKLTTGKRMYIVNKNIAENTLTAVANENDPALFKNEIGLADVNLMRQIRRPTKIRARIRYRQPLFAATLRKEDGDYALIPQKPQRFVTPGQSAVFYDSRGKVLGGGIIV